MSLRLSLALALLMMLAAGCTPVLTAPTTGAPAPTTGAPTASVGVQRWWRAETDVGIAGIAHDSAGQVLPGVTVVVAPAGSTGHEQVVITDDTGTYRLAVGPGDYAVTAYYSDLVLQATAIAVLAGGTSHVDFTFDLSLNRGETIMIKAG